MGAEAEQLPTAEVSNGAPAIVTEPELILHDDPKNHLDLDVVRWLSDREIEAGAALALKQNLGCASSVQGSEEEIVSIFFYAS